MKTLYRSLPQVAEQNVTLLLGENIGMNIDASLDHAIALVSAHRFANVLYLNTVQTPRSMFESARKHGVVPSDAGIIEVDDDPHRLIQVINVQRGDLHKSREWIDYHLSEGPFQYVMVNSWEFAAKNSRYREEAIFFLKELTCGMSREYKPVSVIVYGEELQKETRAQKVGRGGYGKLAALAKVVQSISIKKEFETEAKAAKTDEIIMNYESEITNQRKIMEDGKIVAAGSGTDFSPLSPKPTEVRSSEPVILIDAANKRSLIDIKNAALQALDDEITRREMEGAYDDPENQSEAANRSAEEANAKWDYPFARAEENRNSMSARRYAILEALDDEIRRRELEGFYGDKENEGESADAEEKNASTMNDERRSPIDDHSEEASSDMQVHFAPVFIPAPDSHRHSGFPHQPIHLNSYSPDKPPAQNPDSGHRIANSGLPPDVHSDIIKK